MRQITQPPMHPGRVLTLEFMEPNSLKPYTLSKLLSVPRSNLEGVVRGKRPISADLALRLSRLFGNSATFWINLQSHYELEMAKEKIGVGLDTITPMVTT